MKQRRFVLLLSLLLLLLTSCGPPAETVPEVPPLSPSPEVSKEPKPEPEPAAEIEPAPPPDPEDGDFVRVTDYIPGILVDLQYSGTENFTGQVIYDFQEAYLRYGTVRKLAAAQAALAEQGYGLLIWDAFRPVEAQFRLWEVCPDPVYVANPEKGHSSHSRGNTVDVTLAAPDGSIVEMPTGFDDFSALADRDYSDVPETAAANALLLEGVMEDTGFRPYAGEWWHFSDEDTYPVEENFIPGIDG